MTSATRATTTKRDNRKTCPTCHKQFRAKTRQKYCKSTCTTKASNSKRPKVDRLDKARRNPFMYYLAKECQRAKTLHILDGHTVESLTDLSTVWKYAFKANRYGEVKDFEISHICPVNGTHLLGLLHPDNLCISPKAMNKAHGTSYYGHGKAISRSDILPVNYIREDETTAQVLDRVIAYLGESKVDDLVRMAKLQPSQRHKHTAWLVDHLDPMNSEHLKHIAALDGMTTVALSNLKAELQEKEPSRFQMRRETFKPLRVMYRELQRLTPTRPELEEISGYILQCIPEHLIIYGHETLKPDETQALFDVMHGKAVEAVRHVFHTMAYIKNTKEPERIPPYTPITFNASNNPVTDKPTILSMNFAASLAINPDNLDASHFRVPEWKTLDDLPPF